MQSIGLEGIFLLKVYDLKYICLYHVFVNSSKLNLSLFHSSL